MKDFRCKECNKLLVRIRPDNVDFRVNYENINTNGLTKEILPANLHIKCPRCKHYNIFGKIEEKVVL